MASPTTLSRIRPAHHEPGDLTAFAAAEAKLRRGRGCSVEIRLPLCHAVEPERFLELTGGRLAFLWAPATGRAFAGSGAALTMAPGGRERLRVLRTEADRFWDRHEIAPHPACPEPWRPPRLFGGLSFSAAQPAPGSGAGPWRELGEGCFTLPRFLYACEDGQATLSWTLMPEELEGASFARLLSELDSLLCALGRSDVQAETPETPSAAPRRLGDEEGQLEAWLLRVEAIRAEIAAGRLEKVVAARHCSFELDLVQPAEAVLRRLQRLHPTCTRFAFYRSATTFLGATPERLIVRRGASVRTEALAGSIESGGSQGRRLLESLKDRAEHDFVVRHLVSRLEPACATLMWDERPQIRELCNLLHLETPIEGELAEPVHVLSLVESLHPTPAVGGVPTGDAQAWIDGHEEVSRGWYAGPVGWFDAAGDGEFAVALRSAVLEGRQAHLWAGAGVVANSDPWAEYLETELKLRAVLEALGAGGDSIRDALHTLEPAARR